MNNQDIKSLIVSQQYATRRSEGIYLNRYVIAIMCGVNERAIRECLSELRKELKVIYLPVKDRNFDMRKGWYKLYVEGEDDKELEAYVRRHLKMAKSIYFNDIVKLKKIVKDVKLASMIGRIELAYEDPEADEGK